MFSLRDLRLGFFPHNYSQFKEVRNSDQMDEV